MDYFKILNFNREPFSNSPDPDLFFQSRQHQDCLQKLEIALRLRRGLNVVVGDVGTGKTTLCRQLIRNFAGDPDVETHLMLDPHFPGPVPFLRAIAELFGPIPVDAADSAALKEHIKQRLFATGVDQDKTIVLIIDEGQKISPPCLEILRELLNFETNTYKLLQIVIFAQPEFDDLAAARANFADRINLYHRLDALDFADTSRMIRFRLEQAGSEFSTTRLFTLAGRRAVYHYSGGYPRKIMHLCHRALLTMIIQNRSRVGWRLVRSCARHGFPARVDRTGWRKRAWATGGAAFAAIVFLSAGLYLYGFQPAGFRLAGIDLSGAGLPLGDVAIPGRPKVAKPDAIVTAPPAVPHAVRSGLTEAVPKPVPASVETDTASRKPAPAYLGRLALARGESLWKMIQNIYGVYNPTYLEAVLQANPRIDRPDTIGVGTVVNFPAVPVTMRETDLRTWWIQVGRTRVLTDAVEQLRGFRRTGVPVRLISCWQPREGLVFSLVLQDYLLSETAAESMRESLPPLLRENSTIITEFGDGEAIFFADPYRVTELKG